MTIDEVSKRYNIPLEILKQYEAWGLCHTVKQVMAVWQYDDSDLERLSLMMTLHDSGFSNAEIDVYMTMLLQGTLGETQRLQLLEKRRGSLLEEIHFKERQLENLDYLRHELRRNIEG